MKFPLVIMLLLCLCSSANSEPNFNLVGNSTQQEEDYGYLPPIVGDERPPKRSSRTKFKKKRLKAKRKWKRSCNTRFRYAPAPRMMPMGPPPMMGPPPGGGFGGGGFGGGGGGGGGGCRGGG